MVVAGLCIAAGYWLMAAVWIVAAGLSFLVWRWIAGRVGETKRRRSAE